MSLPRSHHSLRRAVAATLLAALLPVAGEAQVFVTELTAPPAGTYDRSLALHFTATFDAPVVVEGSPRIALQIGHRIRHATWLASLGRSPAATSLTFVYHPEPFDRDEDGIAVVPRLDLSGGSIHGMDTRPARADFIAPDTRGVRVNLLLPPAPRILGLTSGAETKPANTAAGSAFTLRGTADGGSRVTVTLAEVGVVGTVEAAPNGAWSMPYPASLLSPGTHRLTATAEDAAGSISAPSVPLELRVRSLPADQAR